MIRLTGGELTLSSEVELDDGADIEEADDELERAAANDVELNCAFRVLSLLC